MGENNSKWNNGQRINFQNIQADDTTQSQKKKKNPLKSWEKKQTQHYNEISPHTGQNDHPQKVYKQ